MDERKWLINYLKVHKEANVKDIRAAAKGAGIKKRDLKAAKLAIGVVTVNDHVKGLGTENWYWRLP